MRINKIYTLNRFDRCGIMETMVEKYQLMLLLNEVLNQKAFTRLGGNELLYHCPNCHHVKRKLEICIDDTNRFFGAYHCWTCSISGTLYDIVKFSLTPDIYKKKLYEILKNVKFRMWDNNKSFPSNEIVLPEGFLSLSQPIGKDPEYKHVMKYLKKRGILKEDIIRYNLGYCKDFEYPNYIIIPSYDRDGRLNYFIGRKYYETQNTYVYKKPEYSMNIIGFEVLINYKEPIILVESVFNAITIRRNAIPLFGKYPSKKLYEAMIVNKVKDVYVCLDADAKEDAIKICSQLSWLGITPYYVKIEGGKDPNEIGFEKSWECINKAKEFTEEDQLKYALKI